MLSKAFKDKDVDGMSLTETLSEIVCDKDLHEYRAIVSEGVSLVLLGLAVFPADQALEIGGFSLRSDPHDIHKFGYLHALGPTPEVVTPDMRQRLAELCNILKFSCGPVFAE